MSASAAMRLVWEGKRFKLYWATPFYRFTSPGLHLWTGKRHVRLLPMPRLWRLDRNQGFGTLGLPWRFRVGHMICRWIGHKKHPSYCTRCALNFTTASAKER